MKTNFYGHLLVIIIALLTLSIGLNIIFYQKATNKTITHTNAPISEEELKIIEKEIDRLSNIQYDVKTKQPIKNDFIDSKE